MKHDKKTLMIRMRPANHRRLKTFAASLGITLEQAIVVLMECYGAPDVETRGEDKR